MLQQSHNFHQSKKYEKVYLKSEPDKQYFMYIYKVYYERNK